MADLTAPTGTAALDAAAYAPGAIMTLTVIRTDPDSKAGETTVTLADAAGNITVLHAAYTVADPVSVSLSDSLGHLFIRVSDDGSKAVYTAVA